MLMSWVKVTKSRFNEIRNVITKGNESGLVTTIGKKNYTEWRKKVSRGHNQWKVNKNEANKMCNDIVDDANAINKWNFTENRT